MTGNPDKYAMVSKSGDVPAPSGSQDVDWLQLTAVQGELAKTIMRLETKYGQPQPSVSNFLEGLTNNKSNFISQQHKSVYLDRKIFLSSIPLSTVSSDFLFVQSGNFKIEFDFPLIQISLIDNFVC